MKYKILRGWYSYNKDYVLIPTEDEDILYGCKTCKINNYNDDIICLDCRRAR